MKFLKLEILNLASLDNKDGEVINFEQGALSESNLFSIVGPTGSGKSTILDAICLALYNRAPRYPRKKNERKEFEIYGTNNSAKKNKLAPTDCRNILTRGRKEGYSKLTFVANNGYIYRAEWHVRFKLKNFDNSLKLLYKLTLDRGTWYEEKAEWETLPQIIGLDYEQFTRTVIIAQGSFANFLNAKEDERYELLEKLIGCESIYTSIISKIWNRKDEAVTTYNTIHAEHETVQQHLLTDQEYEELNEEIRQREQEENAISDKLKEIEKEIHWYVEDEQQIKTIEQQQRFFEQAKQALTAISTSVERLRLHDTIQPAIDIMRDTIRLESNIQKIQADIIHKEKGLKGNEAILEEEKIKLEFLKKNVVQAQSVLDETIPHINNARKLKIQLTTVLKNLSEKEEAKATAERLLHEATSTMIENLNEIAKVTAETIKAQNKLQTLRQEIKEQKQALAEAVHAAEVKLQAEKIQIEALDLNDLQNTKSSAEKMLTHITLCIDIGGILDNAQEEKAALQNRIEQLKKDNKRISTELNQLYIESLIMEVETLRRSHTLMSSENWTFHRTTLTDGSPCPLCGSPQHPYQHDYTLFDEALSALSLLLASKEKELSEQRNKKEALDKHQSRNEGEIKVINTRLIHLDKEIASCTERLESIHTTYPTLPTTREELLTILPHYKAAQQNAEEGIKTYDIKRRQIESLTDIRERAIRTQREYEESSHKIEGLAEQQHNSIAIRLAQLETLAPNLANQKQEREKILESATQSWKITYEEKEKLQEAFDKELGGADPEKKEQEMRQAREMAEKAVTDKIDAIGRHNALLSATRGALDAQKKLLEDERHNHKVRYGELCKWIDTYNSHEERIREITYNDVLGMLSATDDWNAIRREEEHRKGTLTTAIALLHNIQAQHTRHQDTKPQHTREELLANQQETKQKSRQQELINAKARMESHRKALLLLGTKAEELRRTKETSQEWIAITEAIGKDGKTLRKIAQCYTLRFLIEHANAEIRKFNSRYELEQVKHSLGIRVIDHHRADDIRDTTTLSGGETFIVSLALALGLSSLSSRNISLENLFIDEGFGTLDPDALDTVIDSLAMLQSSQGKKVGVISHTNAMSERITTQIRVIKHGNSGSSHIEVYPN